MTAKFRPALVLVLCLAGPLRATDEPAFRVPPGFRVTLYAGPDLAPDLYAMTLDARGRVVVTSQGWVKTLHEGATPGKAERATVFCETKTGGMGLCFDDNGDLLFCGDGWLSRYRDADGDGKADGPPEKVVPLRFTDHGGHAVRRGPDGWWCVAAGNDSPLGAVHVTRPHSPVNTPEAGGILRLPPDAKSCEVMAHGFRNPYDFDFNPAGDLFTYDSDTERDHLLPWYSPTRLYHVAHAGHHGWRVSGYMRSWARPGFQPDAVDVLAPIGRGSPTGVVCYRHTQFPEKYRGGLFFLDWTFGRVYFTALTPEGASYAAKPAVFLEATGSAGFAPTDCAVAPDGALLVCIGGRRTRGAVYRVEYVGDGRPKGPAAPASDLDAVLEAPQPLDAWSRARWLPLARKLGAAPFAAAVADEKRPDTARVRAAEVLTDLFGGLPADAARAAARSKSALVRARVAWSLGRAPCREAGAILGRLAGDDSPRVRLHSLDAIGDRLHELDAGALRPAVLAGLGHPDKRVRQAAARVASRMPQAAWEPLRAEGAKGSVQARLSLLLAALGRNPPAKEADRGAIDAALALFAESPDAPARLQAVRLAVLALGDYNLGSPPAEVFAGYSVPFPLRPGDETRGRVLKAVRPAFPSGDDRLDDELARLLAMLEDDDPDSPRKVAKFWAADSSPTRDLHFLVALGRLDGKWDGDTAARTADALLSLHHKFGGSEQRVKQNWADRLGELVRALVARQPTLAKELLRHRRFAHPAHITLALALPEPARTEAARLFLKAAGDPEEFAWSGRLVELLAALPDPEVRPAFRERWDDLDLRDPILLQLARKPEAADREKFLAGLGSLSPQAVRAALGALEQLPPDPTPKNLVPLLRLLRLLVRDPAEAKTRARVAALLERQAGRTFGVREGKSDPKDLPGLYRPVFDWFEKKHPDLAAAATGEDAAADLAAWREVLATVEWEKGDARRGEQLFRSRGCLACHTGASRLAPDLTGVAGRFSRDDLFAAIVAPSLDVAPAYQTTAVRTTKGETHVGIVAFQAADGLILLTGADTSVRIPTEEIASRRTVARSLMPDGLLKDLRPSDLADLYRYLQTLPPEPPRPGKE
jgi:putative membrane-bound dehydrogenase-like protein